MIRPRILFFILPFLCLGIPCVIAQQHHIDSLKLRFNHASTISEKLSVLLQLTQLTSDIDLDQAITYANEGLALSDASDREEYTANFYYERGNIYQMMTKYDSAQLDYDAAIVIFKKTNNTAKYAKTLERKGFTYQNAGDFEKTFATNMEALALWETVNDQTGIAYMYTRLADALFYLERPGEGANYGEQAIAIFQQLKDEEGLATAYQYTGDCYLFIKEYEKALLMMNRALEIKQKVGVAPLEIGSLINSRANVLKYLERYDEALQDYNKSLEIAEKMNHFGGISAVLANIGDVYMRMGNYTKALPHKLKSISLQEKHGFIANIMENYDHTSTIYKNLHDYKSALIYREKYTAIRDSVVSAEKDKITSELRTKYETQKKESRIAAQEVQLSQQRKVQLFAFGFAAILLALLFLLYKSIQSKKKNNALLEMSNKQLERKNEENELLLKEIHHRVKNNLQTISSLLNLQSSGIDDPNALEAVKKSQSRVRSMALIHQKLYQGEKLAAVEMKDYFKTMSDSILSSFGKKSEQITIHTPMQEIEIDVDTAIPLGLITNELLTNALKYAFPHSRKGSIAISLARAENGEELCLTVADNGVGLSGEKDTGTEPGTGFGSRLVHLLTMQLGGKMEQHDNNGLATVIRFKPLVINYGL